MSETKNNKHVVSHGDTKKNNKHVVSHDDTKKQKENNYKKFLLYGILLVLVVLVGYVLFSDDKQMYRLATETRKNLNVNPATTTGSSSSSDTNDTSSSNPLNFGSSSSTDNSGSSSSSRKLVSPTSSASVDVGQNIQLSPTSNSVGDASEVRRELKELFREYN